MKAVLLSTRPKWCGKICHEIGTDKNGKPIYEKPIEVRKTKPSIPTPFKVLIYQTKSRNNAIYKQYKVDDLRSGKVIGEFICDEVEEINCLTFILQGYEIDTCLTYKEFYEYGKGKTLYGWHISDLKIYDKPKELSEFYKVGAKSLEELDDELCRYCAPTKYGERRVHLVPNAGAALCEGDYCEEAYRKYLEQEFALTRPPESWCYVQELEERK